MNNIIYNKKEADSLTESEKNEIWRNDAEILKSNLILRNNVNINTLVDIGCAWGQTLIKLKGKIPNLIGVDESLDRMGNLINDCDIHTVNSKSSSIDIAANSADVVLMSHIFHEIKLFESHIIYQKTMSEIKRILKNDGKLVVIDHRDPGPGDVIVDLKNNIEKFEYFVKKYKYNKVEYERKGSIIELSKRNCHDFVTKIWCLNTGAEDLEMNETHTIMNSKLFSNDIEEFKFIPKINIEFNQITNLMNYYGIKLISGDSWGRQLYIQSNYKGIVHNRNKEVLKLAT